MPTIPPRMYRVLDKLCFELHKLGLNYRLAFVQTRGCYIPHSVPRYFIQPIGVRERTGCDISADTHLFLELLPRKMVYVGWRCFGVKVTEDEMHLVAKMVSLGFNPTAAGLQGVHLRSARPG